jgi:hypothetical protein
MRSETHAVLHMPAIATEMVFTLLQSFTTTCFGPYESSSRGTQHQLSFYLFMVLSVPQRIPCFVIV